MAPPGQKLKWTPLVLTLTVLPGIGHFYIKQRLKGLVFISVTLLALLGAIARFFSVFFALANLRGLPRPPSMNPLPLMAQTWKLDYPVLLSFLGVVVLMWILSTVDIWWQIKGQHGHGKNF